MAAKKGFCQSNYCKLLVILVILVLVFATFRKPASRRIQTTMTETSSAVKTILMPLSLEKEFVDEYKGDRFSNCRFVFSENLTDLKHADISVIPFKHELLTQPEFKRHVHDKTLISYFRAPPKDPNGRWRKLQQYFYGTMTSARDSKVVFNYARAIRKQKSQVSTNYALKKTRGVFAYVSQCKSQDDTVKLMAELSKYIDVDIFGGCTGRFPCEKWRDVCKTAAHQPYRFYLSFEDALCSDYITEKFWTALSIPGDFVPVVLGGLSVEDYSRVAPPNSFIHAYNFTSVKELGEYLHHLMDDDAAYNRYHQWRETHQVRRSFTQAAQTLCKLAHNTSALDHSAGATNVWSDTKHCRKLPSGYLKK